MTETVNGYCRAELIRGPAREGRPWKTVADVELAVLSWVHGTTTTGCTETSPTSHSAEFEEPSKLRNGPTRLVQLVHD